MKRTLLVALLLAGVLWLGVAALPPTASASGPCDGPYGGYAGCNYYGGNAGYGYGYGYGYNYYYQPVYSNYGWGYNRVCFYGAYGRLYCSYVRVPAYPVSGYYPYAGAYGW